MRMLDGGTASNVQEQPGGRTCKGAGLALRIQIRAMGTVSVARVLAGRRMVRPANSNPKAWNANPVKHEIHPHSADETFERPRCLGGISNRWKKDQEHALPACSLSNPRWGMHL